MKKIALILTAMAFVVAWGSAYAMEMKGEINNGITVFTSGVDTYDRTSGSAPEIFGDLNNGITVFAAGPVAYDSEPAFGVPAELSVSGSAAGGMRMEGPAVELHNGITIFDEGPALYDTN